MCGINGFIQFKNQYTAEQMRHMVHAMNEKIIHRGPDSEGLYADETCALGMRRLAIIDLDTGAQPIWNAAGDKMIVFNGELYNFRELRKELTAAGYEFRTKSDTEVALIGFEAYGTAFFSRMEGMFALAIYDTQEKRWTFARDRIGEKPLYYYAADSFILFSSELKGLLVTGLVPKVIDTVSLSQYFQLTYIPAPRSILKDVKKLPAASFMTVDRNGKVTIERYWKLTVTEECRTDYAGYKKLLRDALFSSVEKRMISDVPLGTFLSGGIDSTVITGIMSAISDERVNTFTVGFRDKRYDESGLAQIVADRNHTNHHVLYLNWDEAFQDVETVLDNMDEPFADPSLIATYAVSQMTRQYVTVALTGDAGDELFAGYDKYLITYYSQLYNRIPRILRKGIIEPGVKCLPVDSILSRKANKVLSNEQRDTYSQRKGVLSLGFQPEDLPRLMPEVPVDELEAVRRCYEELPETDEQKRAQYVDLNIVLEGCMLYKVDRASMRASLETRVPMLDSRVVELAFEMPSKYQIKGRKKKIILKDTFSDLIPKELYYAPKHGFGVPLEGWLRKELKGELLKVGDPVFIQEQGLFDVNYIWPLIESHLSGQTNRDRQLWTFFVFQYWYEHVFLNSEYGKLYGGVHRVNEMIQYAAYDQEVAA